MQIPAHGPVDPDRPIPLQVNRQFRGPQSAKRVSITADFAKGSSGAGIFNDAGNLTAIVTSTRSIYYSKDDWDAKNLQMVIKDCVPAESIRALVQEPGR